MRKRLRHVCCAWIAVTLCGCGNLDTPDYVKDLRMLAVRLEPPDQVLVPAQLQALPGVQSTVAVAITALIADPNAAGRTIDYTLSTCARLDTTNRNCTLDSVGYRQIAQGQTAALNGTVELELAFAAPDALLVQALAQDPYHGTQGLWLPLQLDLYAGQEHVTGTKLAVYRFADATGNFVPNQNPNLMGVQVGDSIWDAQVPFVFSAARTPKDGFILSPLLDSTAQESYQQPTFMGSTRASQEAWLVDYFSTWGGLSPTTAGGNSPAAAGQTQVPASSFKPPKDASVGPGLFWVIVRDGRGGEDWLVRRAELTP